jgi:tryptophan-rich sensory protein
MLEPFFYILIFALSAVIFNILYYVLGIYGHGKKHTIYKHNKFLPPGFLIGIIWIVVFGSLGYSWYLSFVGDPELLHNEEFPRGWSQAPILTIVVAAYCLLYPFIANYVHEKYIPLLNFIGLIMAYALGIVVIQEYVAAFWYVLPLIVWTTYVCFADLMQYADCLQMHLIKKD